MVPFAVCLLINPGLFDPLCIPINLIWIPFFTIPFSLTGKKIFYKTAVILFSIVGCIEVLHWIILKGPLTVTSLLVVSNTNFNEASEFVTQKATFWFLLLLPYIWLFFRTWKNPPRTRAFKGKFLISSSILFGSLIFISGMHYYGKLARKGVPQIGKVSYAFVHELKAYKQAVTDSQLRKVEAFSALEDAAQVFVLILGESCNRNHMSLYGAKARTTPRLSGRKDIIPYTDVVSTYSNTLESIIASLTDSNIEGNKSMIKADIIDVFNAAGYKTFWLSNQSPIGVWDNLVSAIGNKADVTTFVNTSSNSSMESLTTRSYDEKLFDPFKKALADKSRKKLIVLHLMGNHTLYTKRYPKAFQVFTGEGKKKKIIASYQNSILYNDFVVDNLLSTLEAASRQHNYLAASLYISDHGENVYDELNTAGHDYTDKIPKANVEIPFLVWLSDSFKQKFPGKTRLIRGRVNTPYATDDLFHSIIDLNYINTTHLIPERSVFHSKYNQNRKRILADGNNYDAIGKRID